MNRLLTITVVLLVALAAVAVAAPPFIDWSRFSGPIADYVESKTGYPVEIIGDIQISLLPTPTLTASEVRIVGPGGDGEPGRVASLESLKVELAVRPLLQGRQEYRVDLGNPELHFEPSQGNGNWIAAAQRAALAVTTLGAEGGAITYRDPARGLEFGATEISAEISELRGGGFEALGTFQSAGVPFELAVAVGALDSDRPAGLRVEVRVGEFGDRLYFRGTLSGRGSDPRLRGDLGVEGDDFAALAGVAEALAAAFGLPTLNLPAVDAPYALTTAVVATPNGAEFGEVDVRLADMSAAGALAVEWDAAPRFDATVAMEQIDLDTLLAHRESPGLGDPAAESLPPTNLYDAASCAPPGTASGFALPPSLSGTMALSADAIGYRGQLTRSAALTATVADGAIVVSEASALLPGVTQIEGRGTLTRAGAGPQFDGSVTVRSDDARELLRWLGFDIGAVPERRLRTFAYDGRLCLRPGFVEPYEFVAAFDGTRMEGAATYWLRERPAFRIDAHVDRLNLDSYWPQAPGEPGDASAAGRLDLPTLAVLDTFDTDVRLDVEELTVRGEKMSVNVNVGLQGGALTAREITVVDVAGARGTLRGIAEGFGGTVQGGGNIHITGNEPGSLLRLAGLSLGVAPERLGAFRFDANVDGDQDELNVNVGAELAGAELEMGGTVRDLAGEPMVDLEYRAAHPDLAGLLATLGFGGGEETGDAVSLEGGVRGGRSGLSVDVQGVLGGADVDIDGELALQDPFPFELRLTANHDDGSEYLRQLRIPYISAGLAGPLGPVSIDAEMAGARSEVQVASLDLEAGGTEIEANGSLRLDGGRPRITAEIAATGDVVLDRFLPPSEPVGVVPDRSRRDWSGEPLPFDLLHAVDLDVRIDASAFRYRGLDLDAPRLRAVVRDGRLVVSPFRAGLYGGELDLRLEAVAAAIPELYVQGALEAADLSRVPRLPWVLAPVAGVARIDADLTARGASERELASGVNGTVSMSATGGRLAGLTVEGLGRGIDGLDDAGGLEALLRGALAEEGETEFSLLSLEAEVANGGVAHELTADVKGTGLVGQGTVDLPRRRATLDVTVALADPAELPSFGIEVAGPWDAPRKSIRARDLQAWVARRLLGSPSPAVPTPAAVGPEAAAPEAAPSGAAPEGADPEVADAPVGFEALVGDALREWADEAEKQVAPEDALRGFMLDLAREPSG